MGEAQILDLTEILRVRAEGEERPRALLLLERARLAHRVEPLDGVLGRAFERIESERGRAHWIENDFGLPCPNCHRRGMTAIGGRLYLCLNPSCFGDEGVMRFVSLLLVTARQGARLIPFRIGRRLERLRKTSPTALLGVGGLS